MSIIRKLILRVFGPASKFRVGDWVEVVDGGHLMFVTQISAKRGPDEPLIHCDWYESESNKVERRLFSEEELRLADGYHGGKIKSSNTHLRYP